MESRQTPCQITKQLANWEFCFWAWNIVHYALGVYATVATTVLAASKGPQTPSWIADHQWHLGVTAAVATGVLTYFKSSAKANAYIAAWRRLNAERICYLMNASYTEAQLADVHKQCEEIIGKAD